MAIARLQVQGPRPSSSAESARRRRRALPAHVLDAPALERRDAPARPRALAPRDGVEPAPARRPRRARPRRVPLRDPAAPGRDRARAADRHGPGPGAFARAGRRPARGVGAGRGARPPAALVRRRRRHARRAARQRVGRRRPRADARRLPDRVEQDQPAHARGRLAGGRRPRPRPRRLRDDARRRRSTTGCACATRGARRSARSCARSAPGASRCGVRMLGGTHVGYARLTRRWWAPVRERLAPQQLEDRPIYFVSSNTHSLSNLVTGIARRREDELLAYIEGLPESDGLRGELQALRDGRSEGSWENFLYFVAREWIDAGGAQLREWRREAEAAAGVEHLPSRTAMRVPAQIIPLDRLDAGAPRPAPGRGRRRPPRRVAGGDRQRRLSARPRGVQHPARGRGRRERAARRLRARQGGDAERRRRRRDALERRPRRAQRHDVLARQRLRASRTSSPTCASAPASTTSAR